MLCQHNPQIEWAKNSSLNPNKCKDFIFHKEKYFCRILSQDHMTKFLCLLEYDGIKGALFLPSDDPCWVLILPLCTSGNLSETQFAHLQNGGR